MRILFIVPYVPDLIRARSFNLIRSLARRGHTIEILTVWSSERDATALERLRASGHWVSALHVGKPRSMWNCIAAIPTGEPFQAAYSWHPGARAELTDILVGKDGRSMPDVIHVEHLRGIRYALLSQALLAEQGRRVPVVWDSVDCISLLFEQAAAQSHSGFGRLAGRLDAGRTRRFEGMYAGSFDRVLASSSADRTALVRLAASAGRPADIVVLTNGVDLTYFTEDPGIPREPARLVLTGKMSYHANVSMVLHFVQEVFPEVRRRHPGVELWIVGKDPSKAVREMAERPGIVVTGEVPDLRPYLRSATAAVVPLVYGAGVQFKVLEAMACGTPVVMSAGAARGLTIQAGVDALVASEAEEFARMVCRLLADPGQARRMGEAGRAYVRREHDWSRLAGKLEGVYDELISSGT